MRAVALLWYEWRGLEASGRKRFCVDQIINVIHGGVLQGADLWCRYQVVLHVNGQETLGDC